MNWSSGLSWLTALKPPSTESLDREADCADMGTAFGLDASFGLRGEEPMLAGASALRESTLPWEHRLTRRSGL